ncbi:MAG: helicase, partial [Geobacteraceae bacterium]
YFPKNCTHFEEIKIYFDTVGACDAVIESLKKAWLEYAQTYPERIEPLAWCNECGKKLPISNARLSWSTETQEIYILDGKCLDKYQHFDELTSRQLSTITHSDLEDLVEKEGLSEYDVERLTETLTLWGALPINCPGSVYFIQSEKTHAVKIGFTSGPIEKRLASLQTAHPYKLQLLAALAGTVAYEKSLHDRFAKFRLEGEWFEPHPDLMAFVSVVRLGLGHNNSQERTE